MEKAVSVAGLSLALSAPAFANPWDHSMKPDVQMRASSDGRADLHEAPVTRAERPAPERTERATAEGLHRDAAPIPFKGEMVVRMSESGLSTADMENTAKQARSEKEAQKQSIAGQDRMGRREPAAPLHVRAQIMLREQGEGSAEGDSGGQASVAHRADSQDSGKGHDKKGHHVRSAQEVKEFSKHTGIPLRGPSEGSDDPDDKSM